MERLRSPVNVFSDCWIFGAAIWYHVHSNVVHSRSDNHPRSYGFNDFEDIKNMRILFIDFDGVLHAATGPADTMRRFVWAPILRDLLNDHPDIQVVVHASARDHTPAETIVFQLGAVGILFAGVVEPKVARWEAIQEYLDRHPGADYRILDDAPAEFPLECSGLIICDPRIGISDNAVMERIRDWIKKE